jgi:4-hydroxy-tetrahydrodipicolinate synthase
VHGFVRCGARGAITGVGNALPLPVLRLIALCTQAAAGDVQSYRDALELDRALAVLSSFDEGSDLVLYYKHLMVLAGNPEYAGHVNPHDALSDTQRALAESAWHRFHRWWNEWPARKT